MIRSLLSAALLLSGSVFGTDDVPYIANVECSSPYEDNDAHVKLEDGLSFHWSHRTTDNGNVFRGTLLLEHGKSDGDKWLGVGFSADGRMIGSKAILGSFEAENVRLYDLQKKETKSLGWIKDEKQEELGVTGNTHNGHSKDSLHFTVGHFNDLMSDVKAYDEDGILTVIYAVGVDKWLGGMHEKRGAFRIFTQGCNEDSLGVPDEAEDIVMEKKAAQATAIADVTESEKQSEESAEATAVLYNPKAAFAVHGIFAVLAFCVIIPLAICSAIFRSSIPKYWIYIHVLAQVFAAFVTTISVASAFGGVVMRDSNPGQGNSHFNQPHHYVGFTVLVLVWFQVANGFKRPPIEVKSDPTELYYQDSPYGSTKRKYCCGCIPACGSRRDRWLATHKFMALTIISLALYQLHSGTVMYTTQFGGNTTVALSVLWGWIGTLLLAIFSAKCISGRRAKRLRSTRNLMPKSREDDAPYMSDAVNLSDPSSASTCADSCFCASSPDEKDDGSYDDMIL